MHAAAAMTPMPAAGCENNLRPRDLPRCCFVLDQAPTLRHGLNTLHRPRLRRAPARAARHAGLPLTAEGRATRANAGTQSLAAARPLNTTSRSTWQTMRDLSWHARAGCGIWYFAAGTSLTRRGTRRFTASTSTRAKAWHGPSGSRALTFDMSGGTQRAKSAVARPLDGWVRPAQSR